MTPDIRLENVIFYPPQALQARHSPARDAHLFCSTEVHRSGYNMVIHDGYYTIYIMDI